MYGQYVPGEYVHSSFQIGIVTASYFASLCGCLLTIEMLHNRGTALRNFRSWLETFACSTSMGVVGIWCMHFIGNRAIILGDGDPKIQLVYGSGFTILSVILPVIGLMLAFSVAEIPVRTTWKLRTAVTTSGVCAGLSVVGMHYVGNLGVSNYKLAYRSRYKAASYIIAIGDCLAVLILFYNLREKWISAWWKRILCAMALAGGVSAMHFTASTSCTYTLKHFNTPTEMKSRNMQVIVAAVMCGAAALVVLFYLVLARSRNRQLVRRAQKVTLASAIFDPSGRILVTTDGVLPAREITDRYNHRTFDEDFDTGHPVFQWIFRVTRNWSVVNGLIQNMKSHLHAQDAYLNDSHLPSSQASTIYGAQTYSNDELLFKERFCVAASSIAHSLHLELHQIGVLYDQIVETGTLQVQEKSNKHNNIGVVEETPSQIEQALRLHFLGNGQLMFTVKEATPEETDRLLNAGLRFASVQHVGRTISRAMQIPLAEAEAHLSGLQRYLEASQATEKSGTWLAFFVMIPKPHSKGFDVVVQKNYQDQLPDVQLLPDQPQPWQVSFLDRYNGASIKQMLSRLEEQIRKERLKPVETRLAIVLQQAIRELILPFPPQWIREAKFWSQRLVTHYARLRSRESAVTTTLYAFTVIGDMHASIEDSQVIMRVPKSFFEARHLCYPGSHDNAVLQQRIHVDFAPLYSNKLVRARRLRKPSIAVVKGSGKPGTKLSKSQSNSFISSSEAVTADPNGKSSSVHELVDKPYHHSDTTRDDRVMPGPEKYGGILVNSETVVDTDDKEDLASDNEGTAMPMGRTTNIITAKPETNFVDELVKETKERFLPVSKGRA